MVWDKNTQAKLADYIEFFETLSPETIDHLDEHVTTDVNFVDPFQDVTGVEEMKFVLSKMFVDTDAAKFEVLDYAFGQKQAAYLRWDFTFRSKGKEKTWHFQGMSEVHINDEGMISKHIDHWDSASQLYEKMTGIGSMVQFLKKKVI
ncbi:MAG: hypothetical protein CMP22_01500 [Rickettsiales bacterium]|nr:hypothetical protein [Rickettsiales bacterium]|tara:strand:+ start:2101 stop:2541 length:441 start_codon:yes stop_codon:yes gene_type:complete